MGELEDLRREVQTLTIQRGRYRDAYLREAKAAEVSRLIGKHNVPEILRDLIAGTLHAELGEDGNARIRVLDRETKLPRVSMRPGCVDDMTADEFVSEVLRRDHADVFKAAEAPAGPKPEERGGRERAPAPAGDGDPVQRLAAHHASQHQRAKSVDPGAVGASTDPLTRKLAEHYRAAGKGD